MAKTTHMIQSTLLPLLAWLTVSTAAVQVVYFESHEDRFAAAEIRRYVYLSMGTTPSLITNSTNSVLHGQEVVALLAPRSALLGRLGVTVSRAVAAGEGAHSLHPIPSGVAIVGAARLERLYGAYTFAEALGVRFTLSGDIVPDPVHRAVRPLREVVRAETVAAPAFAYRGLQPFHDFPEGPDWWDADMYRLVEEQEAKMKMNFIGLHTYPYRSAPTPVTATNEPTVWVGTSAGLNPDGTIKANYTYATSYANTMRGEWGYTPLATSSYGWGTGEIFESDCWAPSPTTEDSCPYPTTPAAQAGFFERTADMLQTAFAFGKKLGIESCVGTETPLSKPSGLVPLKSYYSASRRDHFVTTTNCEMCEGLYSFLRVEGYVAPQKDQDHTVPLANCYNVQLADNMMVVGTDASVCPSGYSFVRVEGWAAKSTSTVDDLPLVNYYIVGDHWCLANVTSKQEAIAQGYVAHGTAVGFVHSTGVATQAYYEGIFTRLMKRVPALDWYWVWTPEGWEWQKVTQKDPVFQEAVADLNAAMAARDGVGAPFKMATNGWVVGPLPDRSIFDQVLDPSWDAITSIGEDLGRSPVDPAYKNVTRHRKWLIPWMEDDPDLTAPQLWVNRTLMHMHDAKEYGCTGLLGIHWRTGSTAPTISAMGRWSWNTSLTSKEFYLDWSTAMFGPRVASRAAMIFEGVDSFLMPTVVRWATGPGDMQPIHGTCPLDNVAFADRLAALVPEVEGPVYKGNLEYWVHQFKYMQAMVATECAWGDFIEAMNKTATAPKAERKQVAEAVALPARIRLVRNATVMIGHLQQLISNVGELGTYMNIESRSLVAALRTPATTLEQYLEGPLPADAQLPKEYQGTPRVIVPTPRSTVEAGEAYRIRALVLSPTKCSLTANWRSLGSKDPFKSQSFRNVGRQVFETTVSEAGDFEWYISSHDCPVSWPAGAPNATHTVVNL